MGVFTIVDVAKKAGVSIGTVDRVLHNRPGVSAKSLAAVQQAIKDLGYETNPHASALAYKKPHVIALVIPLYEEDDYWAKHEIGYGEAIEELSRSGIEPLVIRYNHLDSTEVANLAENVISAHPDAVIFQPFSGTSTVDFIQRLEAEKIPYGFIDSKIEDSDYVCFVGVHGSSSGSLGGYLLTLNQEPEDLKSGVLAVRTDDGNRFAVDPISRRREGFFSYMNDNFPGVPLYKLVLCPKNEEENEMRLKAFFEGHPDVRHIILFNSRLYLLHPYLKSHPDPKRIVVGFDALARNEAMLRDGTATMLISQQARRQAREAVHAMSDYVLLHSKPDKRDVYMHMNILTAYNL